MAVARALYRGCLKWTQLPEAVGVHFTVPQTDIISVIGNDGRQWDSVEDAEGVRQLVRWSFRRGAKLNPIADQSEVQGSLDRGFVALRKLYEEYSPSIVYIRSRHEANRNREGILHSVGSVFRHRTLGYRGVIVGWDRNCNRPPEWRERMGNLADQPFYHVLPDEEDCVKLFSGVRDSKYVAEENVELMKEDEPHRLRHRRLREYFISFHRRCYIPSDSLRYEYPDVYDLHEGEVGDDSLAEDADVLGLSKKTEDGQETGDGGQDEGKAGGQSKKGPPRID